MTQAEIQKDFLVARGLPPETDIEPIAGGFTGAIKFVIHPGDDTTSHFIKAAESSDRLESLVLDTEAANYHMLDSVGLAGRLFPKLIDYISTPTIRALVLENLADRSWGKPWNTIIVQALFGAITEVHNTKLPPAVEEALRNRLHHLNTEIRALGIDRNMAEEDKQRHFEEAWNESRTVITNSRRQSIKVPEGLYKWLSEHLDNWNEDAPARFVVRDLNFGNIGISKQGVKFVDPVYMGVGNPASDLVSLGLGILWATPKSEGDTIALTRRLFLADKSALAATIMVLIAASRLIYRGKQDSWMDHHQELLDTALDAYRFTQV